MFQNIFIHRQRKEEFHTHPSKKNVDGDPAPLYNKQEQWVNLIPPAFFPTREALSALGTLPYHGGPPKAGHMIKFRGQAGPTAHSWSLCRTCLDQVLSRLLSLHMWNMCTAPSMFSWEHLLSRDNFKILSSKFPHFMLNPTITARTHYWSHVLHTICTIVMIWWWNECRSANKPLVNIAIRVSSPFCLSLSSWSLEC